MPQRTQSLLVTQLGLKGNRLTREHRYNVPWLVRQRWYQQWHLENERRRRLGTIQKVIRQEERKVLGRWIKPSKCVKGMCMLVGIRNKQ